jgi:hypothetical protein
MLQNINGNKGGGSPKTLNSVKCYYQEYFPYNETNIFHLSSSEQFTIYVLSVHSKSPPRLKTETDPVSETLCFLFVEIRTMDKVQKLNNNE